MKILKLCKLIQYFFNCIKKNSNIISNDMNHVFLYKIVIYKKKKIISKIRIIHSERYVSLRKRKKRNELIDLLFLKENERLTYMIDVAQL